MCKVCYRTCLASNTLLHLLLRRLTAPTHPGCSCCRAFFLESGAFSCRVGLGIFEKSTNKVKALSPHRLSHSICPGLNKELQVSRRVWCAPLNAHDIQQKGPAVHLSAGCTGVAVFRCALELLQSGEKRFFFLSLPRFLFDFSQISWFIGVHLLQIYS